MPKLARIGDPINISCPHGGSGVITGGSSVVFDNGPAGSRNSDSTVCVVCGMPGNINSGSSNVFYDGLAAARVGDTTVGSCDIGKTCCPHSRSGTIADGSPSTNLNDNN